MPESDLPDVNVWLALSVADHPQHALARRYWQDMAGRQVAFCRATSLGLLRLLTDATVMGGQPLDAAGAWSAYQAWRRVDGVVLAPEPDGCDSLLSHWVSRGLLSARTWMDAYLAAFAAAGGWRVVSFDRDLGRFDGVESVLLGT